MKLKRWSSNQVLEFWKDIEGYEGLYMISSLGRVKSLGNNKTKKEKILKPIPRKDGYLRVTLSKNGKMKTFRVHRLVAIAFIPNSENKPYIDHINTIRTDNRVKNLRWVTQKENCNNQLSIKKYSKAKKGKHHSEETKKKMSEKRQGEKNPRARKVRCIETGEIFDCVKYASEWCHGDVGKYLRGKSKSANGYHWEYVEEIELDLNILIDSNINIKI